MPKLMSDEVLHQLLARIEEHIAAHSLADFPIVLHGGMPLLWGIKNFRFFAEACEAISWRARCEIPISVTTNGVLIDDEWLDCLEAHGISVAISLDGPAISTTRIAGPSSVMALTQPWNGPRASSCRATSA